MNTCSGVQVKANITSTYKIRTRAHEDVLYKVKLGLEIVTCVLLFTFITHIIMTRSIINSQALKYFIAKSIANVPKLCIKHSTYTAKFFLTR